MNRFWSLFGLNEQPGPTNEQTNDGLPVPNSTLSYWRSELHPIDSYRSSEHLPSECDIAIIGAGITGVSTAYHLSRLHAANNSGKKPSIVILEAREVCSGATGRNGGHSKMRISSIRTLFKDYDAEAADECVAFVYSQSHLMKEAVDREGLHCEFELRRTYDVFVDGQDAKDAEETYRTAVKEGHKWVKEVSFVDSRYAEQVTSIKGAKAAVSMPACSLWPYRFVTQLLSCMIDRKEVSLYTHTPITSIDSSNPAATILHTPNGSVTTKKLIFATNAYTSAICPSFKEAIIPYKGTACHIAPENPISPHLNFTYNIYYDRQNDPDSKVDYLNPRPDSGIIVGGANWLFKSHKSLWYNTTDDSTLIPNTRPYFSTYMQNNFLGWEDSNAKITHLWTGIQGETKDGKPFVGKVPGKGNWYIAAGFNGGGMSFCFSCAEGLAGIVEGKTYEESGLPRMFSAERLG
ncbi:FAD dependent oxidoreductase [Aureobasidium pullulans]|uniref:FAD dependent oxidoreductase n=1 Tax=Aureobasidium pullulans TaxID=5580 RepID=A0A4S9L207_AURPU|nr:FAD dependent oxidoreductase [Aureobasidium pullulans]